MENERIDYTRFESKYWTPDENQLHELVFAVPGWMEEKTFEGKPKVVMCFSVLEADKKKYLPGEKIFTTGASSFAEQYKDIEADALANEQQDVEIRLLYDGRKYTVVPLHKLNKILDDQEAAYARRKRG